jgi:DNA-binding transcriptional ArsR family regulator
MTQISYDSATAYDFFISLTVLHYSGDFGLRPSWAAGVRSRLPACHREFLERTLSFLSVPLGWLYRLAAQPKDSAAVLDALNRIPAEERLPALTFTSEILPELKQALLAITAAGKAARAELTLLRAELQRKKHPPRANTLEHWAAAWADPAAFGQAYLEALRAYRETFFAEEEERIRPALEQGLQQARALADRLPLQQLVDALTRGVEIKSLNEQQDLVLVPSYWSSPLVFYSQISPAQALLVFGSRAEEQALVPGEQAPAALIQGLKALSDPSRLQILRFLAGAPHTPSQLARRLRLRAPTVIHHLNALRLAGLVHISVSTDGERCYTLRREALAAVLNNVRSFLVEPGDPGAEPEKSV